MKTALRSITMLGFLGAMSTLAFAAASQAPTAPAAVDPQLRNATPYVLSLKVFDQCLLVQSRLMETTREAVHTPCSCYAKATIAQMNKEELDYMRENGFLGDSARDKAIANLDRCKLKRPPGV
jgi:hypothetical protein